MTKLLKFSVLQITYTKKMTSKQKKYTSITISSTIIAVKHAHIFIIYSPNLHYRFEKYERQNIENQSFQ